MFRKYQIMGGCIIPESGSGELVAIGERGWRSPDYGQNTGLWTGDLSGTEKYGGDYNGG